MPWNVSTGNGDSMMNLVLQPGFMNFHEYFTLGVRITRNSMFHGIWCWRKVPQSTYLPCDLEKFHWIVKYWNQFISLKEGSVFCFLLYDFVCIAGNSLVVEILRYHSSKQTFGCPWFRLNGDITFSTSVCQVCLSHLQHTRVLVSHADFLHNIHRYMGYDFDSLHQKTGPCIVSMCHTQSSRCRAGTDNCRFLRVLSRGFISFYKHRNS